MNAQLETVETIATEKTTQTSLTQENPKTSQENQKLPRQRAKLKVINKNYQLGTFSWHHIRKAIHIFCVLIFIALPFFNVMRFDIPRQRFYFAGYELWINEFAIIFFSMMFLMFLVAAASMLYGRIYCGYLCPQMIFSEASIWVEEKIRTQITKWFPKWSPSLRRMANRIVFYSVLGIVSVFLAFVFISYFVEPRDLFWRLMSLDIKTAGGIGGATVTLITFLDFVFLRQRFCTTVCPYGYLQGILGDDDTLIIQYRDKENLCVECGKCVRICHMGIDIRHSAHQIECIHCGECVDACDFIMGKFGKKTLIHYVWGEKGETLGDKKSKWYRRLGVRDAKRIVVLLIILFYASGLFVALSMRHSILVQIAPDRTTLNRTGENGEVYNKFRMTLANRSTKEATVTLTLNNLPNGKIHLPSTQITLKAGESIQQEFEISVPAKGLTQEVNHFEIISKAMPDETTDTFKETFIMPLEKKK